MALIDFIVKLKILLVLCISVCACVYVCMYVCVLVNISYVYIVYGMYVCVCV